MNELVEIVNNQVVVSSRQVAENFEKQHKDVLESIRDILAAENSAASFFSESTYESRGKQYPEFLMNRDGFTLLAMGFTGTAAMQWKLKYIQAFNEMEKQLNALPEMSQIQIVAAIAKAAAEQEKRLTDIAQRQDHQSQQLQDMRDVITLCANGWREDTRLLITKIALSMGGYEHVKDVRAESYRILDDRMGVNVQTRLTNKRRRMAEEGVCKSKRDGLNPLDVIGEDKKLIEGYVSIIKQMAIKYGVAA